MKVTAKQIFGADKTAFHRKRMPSRTFIAREKLVPAFKVSEDRLSYWGLMQVMTFKLKLGFFNHSENLRGLRNYAKSTLPVFCNCNNKSWMIAYLFTAWFTEYVKPTVEMCCSKKPSFQNFTAH